MRTPDAPKSYHRQGEENVIRLLSLLLTLVMFLPAACSKTTGTKPVEDLIPRDATGNFTLHVSNQSFAISPVDITIYFDGKKALEDDFDVGNQHNWVSYTFRLSKGTHELVAVSEKGGARINERFEIEDEHWAVVDYWYYPKVTGGAGPTPKQFSFGIQDKPIYFE
jgi:hypothetical protein